MYCKIVPWQDKNWIWRRAIALLHFLYGAALDSLQGQLLLLVDADHVPAAELQTFRMTIVIACVLTERMVIAALLSPAVVTRCSATDEHYIRSSRHAALGYPTVHLAVGSVGTECRIIELDVAATVIYKFCEWHGTYDGSLYSVITYSICISSGLRVSCIRRILRNRHSRKTAQRFTLFINVLTHQKFAKHHVHCLYTLFVLFLLSPNLHDLKMT